VLKLGAARCERLSDGLLGLLLVLPAALLTALSYDCGPWDEGRLAICGIAFLSPVAQTLQALVLVIAFGGIFLYLPVVGGAYANSTRYKYRAWKAGALRPLSAGFLVWALASCLVVAAGVLIVLSMFSS
jgi:hypothetical protein